MRLPWTDEERAQWDSNPDTRWLLEEFRVSLYAQALKTRVPVSARRLEDAWAEREKTQLA